MHFLDCSVEDDCLATGLDLDLPLGREDFTALEDVLGVEGDSEGLYLVQRGLGKYQRLCGSCPGRRKR